MALTTCTIITTTLNADMDEIHDRMPVVLELDDVETRIETKEQLLLRPAPDGTLARHTVNAAVGSVRNDVPELIEPAEPRSFN